MTIDVEETHSKIIKWGKYFARFDNGIFAELNFMPSAEEIISDPDGFYGFAGMIVDEVEDNKPKPEKPARKPRSDKGLPKKRSITKTDTNEQVEMPTPDMKQIEERSITKTDTNEQNVRP